MIDTVTDDNLKAQLTARERRAEALRSLAGRVWERNYAGCTIGPLACGSTWDLESPR